jgi:hypothetical protein
MYLAAVAVLFGCIGANFTFVALGSGNWQKAVETSLNELLVLGLYVGVLSLLR